MQCSNYDKIRKTLLFSSVPTNLFPFLTRERQNKIQKFRFLNKSQLLYLFILFMPLMVYGGGLEEIGWQGILQPILQKRLPFLAAAIIGGIVWSIWHLPLWFIPNSSQSSYSFPAFTLFCITLGVTLAATHKITGSIWVSVLLHAWSNTVLGGMYSLISLCQFPNAKTLLISVVQILAVTGVLYLYGSKQGFYRDKIV